MTDFDRTAGPPQQHGTAVFLQVGLGIGLVFLLHLIVGGSLWGAVALADTFGQPVADDLGPVLVTWMASLGVGQVLYVGPVAAALFFVRRPIALGMAIGAALTFLLQGACYGFVGLAILQGYDVF